MGFVGYALRAEAENHRIVRIFLECQEDSKREPEASNNLRLFSCTYAIDFIFPGGDSSCRLDGVNDILALKKFYKLVHSLEERAREHGNDRSTPLRSPEGLLQHLAFTRNARDFTGQEEPRRRRQTPASAVDCASAEGSLS
ncbi:MAG: hypothetical protein HY648_06060 [Acidobacteria bacterium]|nr:hypothetical protein [Acidobacteriota bacterium]